MKANKTILVTVFIAGSLLAGSPVVRADGSTNKPPATPPAETSPSQRQLGMRSGPNLEQLTKALSLKDDQITKVKPILDARDQKLRDVRNDASLQSDERRTKLKAIRDDMATQMQAVLTPEQFDKWQKMSPMGQRQLRPIGPHPGDEKPGGTNAPVAPPKN